MEVKVIEEKDNVFLGRKDVKLEIIHHGQATPSMKKVEEIICEKFNTEPEKIIIRYIFTKTGIGESIVSVQIYNRKVREIKKEEEQKEGEEAKEEAPAEGEEAKAEEEQKEQKEEVTEGKEESKAEEEAPKEEGKEEKSEGESKKEGEEGGEAQA